MDTFDRDMKLKAKVESASLPQGFEERIDKVLEGLRPNACTLTNIYVGPLTRFRVPAITLCIFVMLTCSAFAAVYTLSGGDFFKEYFLHRANEEKNSNFSYMNTEQLSDMASSTVGTVVDTDELNINVKGVIVSGNTAEIMLRVTAKQMDSVLYETGAITLENYRFHDSESGSLFNDFNMSTTQYYYSDQDKSLAPNQFDILYTMIGNENFKKDKYTIELKDFGFFDFSRTDQFEPLYRGNWEFEIAFDPNSDSSKSISCDQQLKIGDYRYTLDSVNLTPLTCKIDLHCNQNESYIDQNIRDIFPSFSDACNDCKLVLTDGSVIDNDQFEVLPSGGAKGFALILIFHGPITVEDVAAVSLFGNQYPLASPL